MSITDATKKIIQASLAAFDEANVYDDIISYVIQKHALELSFISDPDVRYNVMNQRAATVLEELGVVDDLVNIMKGVGLTDLLSSLQDEKDKLQQKQMELSEQLNALTKDLVDLQISAFGQLEFKVDSSPTNFSLPLKRPEDVASDPFPEPPIATVIKSWRSVQPNELTLGIRGSIGQVVLVRLAEGVWSLGLITQLLYREEPLSLIDLNQHVNNGGSKISSERYRSEAKSDGNIRYLVNVEYPSQRQFCDVVDQTKVALSLSSEALMQKYPVGARVVALYQDANGVSAYYSGIVGEPPNSYNNYRYLIFFDDGYAYYAQSDCIFRVFAQSKENWRLVNPEIQDFIKRYLAQFPQRPMVKLSVDQTIQAELNGNWLQATVVQVDYSLVLLRFPSGNVEWIYRGSKRLGPLSNKPSTNGSQSVEVDYASVQTHLVGEHGLHQKTRKSATGREPGRKPLASVPSVASSADAVAATTTPPSLQEAEETGRVQPYLDSFIQSIRVKPYVDHKCVAGCLKSAIFLDDPSSEHRSESPFDYRGLNPLEIPLRAGWLRVYIKATPEAEGRDVIAYVAPCGRHIRSFSELDHFLHQTGSQLTSDLFCFDKEIKINEEFRCEKAFIRIADLSYGKENVPVPCVNSVDNESPCFIDYIPNRKPIGSVEINEDPDFLVCCDCTDNCRDRTKCACQQLTVEASAFASTKGMVDSSVGYRYRRLSQFTMGGIYECNSRCKCDRRCQNRVVQQGVWVRTQVFKTNRKGWGIRALNAIPKGAFICTYAGAIYDDTKAIEEGYDNGDEYQAELDYIETVEKHKIDYEPYAIEPEESSDFDPPTSNPSVSQPRPPASSRTARKRGGRGGHVRQNSSSSVSSYSVCSNVSKVGEKAGTEADSTAEQAVTMSSGDIKVSPPSSSPAGESEETIVMSSILDQALAFASSSTTDQIKKVEEREDGGVGCVNPPETKFNPEAVVIKKCDDSPKSMTAPEAGAIEGSDSGNNGDKHSESSDTGRVKQIKSEEPNSYTENAEVESTNSCSSDVAPTDSTAVNTVVPMDVTTSAGDDTNKEEPTKPLRLSEFTISAPGLTSFEGISNLSEIMASASFDRLPVVRLTRLSKQEKHLASLSMKQSRGGSNSHLAGHLTGEKMWLPATRRSFIRSPRPSALAMAYRPTGPRQLLLIASLKKSASNADIAYSTSHSTEPKRSSSAVDLLQMNQSQARAGERRPRGRAREHRIHTAVTLTTGNGRVGESTETSTPVGALTASPSTSTTVPWANRRFYPIAQRDWLPARNYFGDEEPFVMDAKKMGNLGRYFNHSCEPNVFVQNVFISSHDPRFPEVAFFAKRNIAAGEELTWDYGYVVDAVPCKVLYCYCGEPSCRIRLL